MWRGASCDGLVVLMRQRSCLVHRGDIPEQPAAALYMLVRQLHRAANAAACAPICSAAPLHSRTATCFQPPHPPSPLLSLPLAPSPFPCSVPLSRACSPWRCSRTTAPAAQGAAAPPRVQGSTRMRTRTAPTARTARTAHTRRAASASLPPRRAEGLRAAGAAPPATCPTTRTCSARAATAAAAVAVAVVAWEALTTPPTATRASGAGRAGPPALPQQARPQRAAARAAAAAAPRLSARRTARTAASASQSSGATPPRRRRCARCRRTGPSSSRLSTPEVRCARVCRRAAIGWQAACAGELQPRGFRFLHLCALSALCALSLRTALCCLWHSATR
jgi:hypothetical protein